VKIINYFFLRVCLNFKICAESAEEKIAGCETSRTTKYGLLRCVQRIIPTDYTLKNILIGIAVDKQVSKCFPVLWKRPQIWLIRRIFT